MSREGINESSDSVVDRGCGCAGVVYMEDFGQRMNIITTKLIQSDRIPRSGRVSFEW